jgi:hypothetical protein
VSIVAGDIEVRYSGGAGNTSAAAALGGAMGTAAGATIDDNVANDLWPDVGTAEQAAGSTKYRGMYVKNNHGTLTLQDARFYITNFNELDVGIAVEAVNVDMATIANETTAPTSVSFSHPGTYGAGLQLNGSTGLAAGARRGVWNRRTIALGATAGTRNTETFNVEGATL